MVPALRELSGWCVPDWSFLDFLSKEKPGGVQLRVVIFRAFAARARERGLRNQLILSTVNGLVGAGVAAAALRASTPLAAPGALGDLTAAELKQRVQASWNRRRVTNNALEESYRLTPELTVDGGGRHAVLGNENIELTAKEHGLLLCLCRSFGRVLSRAELIARVWGNDSAGSPRTVDIHVRRLRSKLGSALPLYTVRGAGYLLKVGQRWEAVADEAAVPPSGVSGVERPLAASTAA
jgi:DNA-binding winged helix-turn-helix (wHTH) protein